MFYKYMTNYICHQKNVKIHVAAEASLMSFDSKTKGWYLAQRNDFQHSIMFAWFLGGKRIALPAMKFTGGIFHGGEDESDGGVGLRSGRG
jgi:hypothetical protein